MDANFKLVYINDDYYKYLKKFDFRIQNNYDKKNNRPYVGIVFKIGEMAYFAPLSSPKQKHLTMHNTIDFFKVNDGKFGAINFNNMIPVMDNNYVLVDLNKKYSDKDDVRYQMLLNENLNNGCVRNKAQTLYNLYKNDRLPKNVMDRCCDFKLLESKCVIYNKKKVNC